MQTKEMKILEKEEVEEIERILEKNYGAKINLKEFLLLRKDEKIWIASKEILNQDLTKLNINSIGMNFGKLKRNEKIVLTIEGSQIVGREATKNVVLLDRMSAEKFMQGFDVKPKEEINCEPHNFVIVKFGEDVLGSSLLTEEGIKNLIPKSRRIPIQLKP